MEKSYSTAPVNVIMLFARGVAGIYNWFNKNMPVSYLLILLFGYTAFSKVEFFTDKHILDVERFKAAMLKSPVLQHHVNQLGYIIPATEIVICLLLLFNRTKLLGYYASFALLSMFTGYIVYMFTHYPVLPCTCGGVISTLSWKNHLLLNIGFALLTLRAIYLTHTRKRPV
jgi:hypothetical protein